MTNAAPQIKKFWETTENTVRIHIYAAICAYCLVAIVQQDMLLNISTYEVLQILSISLTNKTCLKDLFNKTIFNMTMNDSDQMDQVYLIFNNVPILMGH